MSGEVHQHGNMQWNCPKKWLKSKTSRDSNNIREMETHFPITFVFKSEKDYIGSIIYRKSSMRNKKRKFTRPNYRNPMGFF